MHSVSTSNNLFHCFFSPRIQEPAGFLVHFDHLLEILTPVLALGIYERMEYI